MQSEAFFSFTSPVHRNFTELVDNQSTVRNPCHKVEKASKKELDVVAAFIERDGKLLLCQRKKDDTFGLLWEFPGGKVEEKEPLDYAIEREIKEELGVTIKATGLLKDFYDEISPALSTESSSSKLRKGGVRIHVYLFNCCIIEGRLNKKDCHDFGFFTLREIAKLRLAPVDRKIFLYLRGHHII